MNELASVKTRTIPTLVRLGAEQHGERPFLFFGDDVYSFADLDRQSDAVAASLQSLGIGKGDKVAIVMGNRPEFVFLWLGLSKLGAVEVPINTAHRGAVLSYMVDQADCRLIVTEAEWLDRVSPVLPDLPKVERVAVLAEPGEAVPALAKPTLSYREVVAQAGAFDPVEVCGSDPFAITFTSGTTGPSKGPLLPHNYALCMGEQVCAQCEYTEADRLYNALPLFHGNAQVLSTIPALMSGAQVVLAERFSASRFWSDVRRFGCTEFNYLGAIVAILLKAEPRPDDADNPLRVMVGAGCPPEAFEEFERRFGVTMLEGYGMSEIGLPFLNTLRKRKPGTAGPLNPGYQVKLVDDEGEEVGPGAVGEILVRLEQPYAMMLEYYRMPEATVASWRDLWFHTGDYGKRDEDGFYSFVDRKKDALRRRGENISSHEVEQVVNAHPAVLESAAVAVKDPLGEDEVMICVVLKPGAALSPEGLLEHCHERMAYFMTPRYVRFVDALPKTATEKVQKAKLREEGVAPGTFDREAAGVQLRR